MPPVSESCLGVPDRVASAVSILRGIVASLDNVLDSFEQDPGDAAPCPEGMTSVQTHLAAGRVVADSAGLLLLGRVLVRAVTLVERIQLGQADWSLMGKLALEELISVVDMILDVVELVGMDSACRYEERVSFRILASVAPQVLTDIDGMDFRQIRFHQAAPGGRLLRTA